MIIKNGTFGSNPESFTNNLSPQTNDDGSFGGLTSLTGLGSLGELPRILNFDFSNNKYTNLLRKIADFAGVSLPF